MCLSSLCPFLSDGWAFTNNIDINQHLSLEDRLSAARILVQKEPLCPVVVDDMSNVTAIKYGAMPERLYVLQAGKVAYKVRAAVGLNTCCRLSFLLPSVPICCKVPGTFIGCVRRSRYAPGTEPGRLCLSLCVRELHVIPPSKMSAMSSAGMIC